MNKEIFQRLVRIVGPRNVLSSPEDLHAYSVDASLQYRAIPSLVVRPGATEEVQEIIALANREKIPVVPRGAGTNFVGGVVPVRGGIVLDLTRMNKILEISRTDLRCDAEPGVVHGDLETALGLRWRRRGRIVVPGRLSGRRRTQSQRTAFDWSAEDSVQLPSLCAHAQGGN